MLFESHGFQTLADMLRYRAQERPDHPACTFLLDADTESESYTYGQLDRKIRSVAAAIQAVSAPGERALLLYPPGLDFIVAYFACLYAGIVAVPAYPPRQNRHLLRLQSIVSDAAATVILTSSDIRLRVRRNLDAYPQLAAISWLATDEAGEPADAEAFQPVDLTFDSLAFLQYTSGSTGDPKGVMVSHGNLLHNCDMIRSQWAVSENDRYVSWLPTFHDMGLIGMILTSLYVGASIVLMAPVTFIQKPLVWLQSISRYRGTFTASPNFGYDLCVKKIADEDIAALDLSSWRVAANGAEPVRAATLEAFTRRFAPAGFRPEAWCPCYGLAEATLLVSGHAGTEPLIKEVDKLALERNELHEAESGRSVSALVGCGPAADGIRLAIVNPDTLQVCPPGTVGEIWIAGPAVAHGYWQRPNETSAVFQARIAGSQDGPYLRTGDLGFLDDGNLFVTGRIKDLIVIRGRNLYPQDLEMAAERCHPALHPGAAAFTVEEDGEERLVLVQEVTRHTKDTDAILLAIRRTLAQEFEVTPTAIVLIRQSSIPKTSSGKIQRRATRADFLAGRLLVVDRWQAEQAVVGRPEHPELEQVHTDTVFVRPAASAVERWLTDELARVLKVNPARLDVRAPFADYGLDSVQAVELAGRFQEWIGVPVSATMAWDFPSISAVARHFSNAGDRRPAVNGSIPDEPTVMPSAYESAVNSAGDSAEPIAIVGLACRFPQAPNPDAFWELLRQGRDAIAEVPADRFDLERFYDPDASVPGKTSSKWGGFLENVDQFDPAYFGISPREAASMDPQQRLLLELAIEALNDAGLPAASLEGSDTGVFVGISTNEYSRRLFADSRLIDIYSGTGGALSIAANRLSYLLDLRGPSLAVDTACSSSLVAVHLACRALAAGEAGSALVGGVNLILSPDLSINFAKMGAMAPDGRCKSFDARADGYVRGEGAGMLVLKPLSRALKDRDRVYAVIRGSAVNQDGRSNGLTAPNRQAQEEVLREAYRRAGISPGQVQYVETHGTGTPLGDPIEASALGSVLAQDRADGKRCLIGSVKTNIGHLEAAAGIAGLIKTALALWKRELPASLHFESPNPHIPFGALPLQVQQTLTPWPAAPGDRTIAGVSSFGFGGTNAHLVLEGVAEAVDVDLSADNRPPVPVRLLPLCAHSPEALTELARSYVAFLSATSADPGDLGYSASVRRDHLPVRLAVPGRTPLDWATELQAALDGQSTVRLPGPEDERGTPPRVAFVFSGHGGYWLRMAQGWLDEPLFAAVIDRCDELFRIYDPAMPKLRRHFEPDALSEADIADDADKQLAVFAVQVALSALWQFWGVTPAAVCGHSMGEVAAAHAAGILSLEDAACVMFHRSRLLRRFHGTGRMAAAAIAPDPARTLVREAGDGIFIGAFNSPRAVIFSGETAAMEAWIPTLKSRGIAARFVQAETPGHCPLIEPIRSELTAALSGIRPQAARVPFFSTVSAAFLNGPELDGGYWGRNLCMPVRFADAAASLLQEGIKGFLELGPHPVLASAIRDTAADVLNADGDKVEEILVLPALRRGDDDRAVTLASLAELYSAGLDIRWENLYPSGRLLSLPLYPWQRERLWFEADNMDATNSYTLRSGGLGHPLLERTGNFAATGHHFWETDLETSRCPYLLDHRVKETPLLPAAAYLEMAASAAAGMRPDAGILLADVVFKEAMFLPSHHVRTVQLLISSPSYEQASFEIVSRPAGLTEAPWTAHAAGTIRFVQQSEELASPVSLAELSERMEQELDVAAHYKRLRTGGGEYGPTFQGMERLWQGSGEALARIRLHDSLKDELSSYGIHPVLLDCALQALGGALKMDGLYLPVGVDGLRLFAKPEGILWSHAVFDNAASAEDTVKGTIRLYDAAGRLVALIEGLCVRRMRQSNDHDVENSLYKMEWLELPSRPLPFADENRGEGLWLLLADGSGVAEHLAQLLAEQGDICHRIVPGETFAEEEGRQYRINPDRADDYKRLLTRIRDRETRPIKGVVHLWGLDAGQSSSSGNEPGGSGKEKLIIQSVVHLIQQINGYAPAAPRLWIVTRGACELGAEPVYPDQAFLWGIGSTAALELPSLRCVLADLDPAENAETASARLNEELINDGGENRLAYRSGKRYAPRLVRLRADDASDETIPAGNTPFHLKIAKRGNLDNLQLQTAAERQPGPGEVAVQVMASGINFTDVLNAMNILPIPDRQDIPGWECSGYVSAVGPDVKHFHVGDEVVALAPWSLGSQVIAPAELVTRKPDHLSFVEAAGIPAAFLTAYYALHYIGRMRREDRVLIHSASGGVGLAAIQLAQLAGATVFATAGSAEKRAYLSNLGIEYVYDSRSLDFAKEILEDTGGEGIDLVLNSLSGDAIEKSLSLLRLNGRFLEIGVTDIYKNRHLGMLPFQRSLTYASVLLYYICEEKPALIGEMLREIMDLFRNGSLKPLPCKVFPVSQAIDAFRFMTGRRHIGKIVIDISESSPPIHRSMSGPQIRSDAAYLITGGNTGLGLLSAKWLVSKGARHLILTGRRPPGEETLSVLETWGELGVNCLTVQADIGDYVQAKALFEQFSMHMPPLAGIIHSAAVLEDGMLSDLTWERFAAVMRPKVSGAWNLHLLSREEPLDFFILYSSAASVLGSPGQANYVAANTYMDALAAYRRRLGLPAMSVSWGPWAEVGGAARPDRGGRLAGKGILSLPPETGIRALERLLMLNEPHPVVVAADWEDVLASVPGNWPILDTLAQEYTTAETQAAECLTDDLRTRLLSTPVGDERIRLLEKALRETVARILRISKERISSAHTLVSLGMDSLMSIELKNWIEHHTGVTLPISILLQGGSILELAAKVSDALPRKDDGGGMSAKSDEETEQQAERRLTEKSHPLTPNQLSLWFMHQLSPESSSYHVPKAVRIPMPIDAEALRAALNRLIRRHPALRTTFTTENKEPVQRIHQDAELNFRTEEASNWSETKLTEHITLETNRPFDLVNGPLMRICLFSRSPEDHILLIVFHHIIMDGWSFWIFFKELFELYHAEATRIPLKLPSVTAQYAEYLEESAQGADGDDPHAEYWIKQLDGADTTLRLPTDRPRPPIQTFNGASYSELLDPLTSVRIKNFAEEREKTLYTVLLAAWQTLLHLYTGQQDLVVGTAVAGRNHSGVANLIGYFVNMLAIRGTFTDGATHAEFLSRTHETVLEAFAHQELPFSKLVQLLRLQRDPSRSPVFQASFTWQQAQTDRHKGMDFLSLNLPGLRFDSGPLVFESYPLRWQGVMWDLALMMSEVDDRLGVQVQYNTDLFNEETIQRLICDFSNLLNEISTSPESRIQRISVSRLHRQD